METGKPYDMNGPALFGARYVSVGRKIGQKKNSVTEDPLSHTF